MSEVGDHASFLADHPEERQHSPVEELLAEWLPGLDDDEITRCASIVRQAAEVERLAEDKTMRERQATAFKFEDKQ